jgi:hypothetical protein
MASRIYTITIDAHDPATLAEFWRQVLDFEVAYSNGDEVAIEPPGESTCPALLFGRSSDGKTTKNRIHLDLAPNDQAAEVERLLALGARRVNIGHENVPWVVLADPEGNEFCILTPRDN